MKSSLILNFVSTWLLIFSLVQNVHGIFDESWYMIPPIGKITVYSIHLGNESIFTILDQPAAVKYASQIPTMLEGVIVPANPINACKRLAPVPKPFHYHEGDILEKVPGDKSKKATPHPNLILLAVKSDCKYQTKVEYAHAAGYSAIIIYNSGSNETEVIEFDEEMVEGENSKWNQAYPILVPAFFVGEHNGQTLRKKYSANPTVSDHYEYFVKIETTSTLFEEIVIYILWGLFLIFFLVIATCMLRPPWCKKKYEDRKKFLLIRTVRNLPVFEWKEEMIDKHDKCPICLDTYKNPDVLRSLPCCHCFHVHCIDKWLIKVRRNCPICKTKLKYSRCFEEFTDSEISEGNYFTGNIRERTNRTTSTTSIVTVEEEIFDDEFDELNPVVQTVLNTRTLNEERNWSSSETDSSDSASIYTVCESSEDYQTTISSPSTSSGGQTSPSSSNSSTSTILIECSAQVHEESGCSVNDNQTDNDNEHEDFVVIES